MKDVDRSARLGDRVRYVGMPIAVAVAEDRYAAEDGAAGPGGLRRAAASCRWTTRWPTTHHELYDDWPDNKLMDLPVAAEVDRIFAEHDVVRTTFRSHG